MRQRRISILFTTTLILICIYVVAESITSGTAVMQTTQAVQSAFQVTENDLINILIAMSGVPHNVDTTTREKALNDLRSQLRVALDPSLALGVQLTAKLSLGANLLQSNHTRNWPEGGSILENLAAEYPDEWQGQIAKAYVLVWKGILGEIDLHNALEQLEKEALPAARRLDAADDPLLTAFRRVFLDGTESNVERLFLQAGGAIAEQAGNDTKAEVYYRKLLDTAETDSEKEAAETSLRGLPGVALTSRTLISQDVAAAAKASSANSLFATYLGLGSAVALILMGLGTVWLIQKNKSQ